MATWNVWGLSLSAGTLKTELIVDQMIDFKIDICAMQETKTIVSDEMLVKGYKVILMGSECRHYGLGFIVSPRLKDYVVSYQYISDRVSVLDVRLPTRNGQFKMFRFVNAYGPTKDRVRQKGISVLKLFYHQLTKALKVPARYELFVLGDLNAKLGNLSKSEVEDGILTGHVGRYAAGNRNTHGEHLLDFMTDNDLFAINTAFQHPCRHRTTRVWSIDLPGRPPGSTEKLNTYVQIDYILCRRKAKSLFTDARSFEHPRTVIKSDHRLVRARIDLSKLVLLHKKPKTTIKRYDVNRLLSDRDVKASYQTTLEEELSSLNRSGDPNQQLADLFELITKSAESVIGLRKPQQKQHYSNDGQLVALVGKRSKLRTEKFADNRARDMTDQRALINRTEKEINQRVIDIVATKANTLCDIISNTESCRQTYSAFRELTNTQKNTSSVYVHNDEGMNICSDSMKADAIKAHFQEQFTDEADGPLPAFDGLPKVLDSPITPEEVRVAVSKLKNGKSNGPDNIPNELLKAWHPSYNQAYAEIINESFSTGVHIESIGQGILTPLQKPGKPKGPMKSLRPLMLLNGSRKIMSLIVLSRISEKIDQYTGPWQAAYKNGRSCADLVWAQRMLISVVQTKDWEYSKMGIDMSAAFDTIKRKTVLKLLVDAGCTDDEVRLVRYMLANTKLRVRVNSDMSVEFESSIGAFQGDSLSGKLFTLVLAGALYDVRSRLQRSEPPVSPEGLPEEKEYADDVNYLSEDMDELKDMLPQIKDILAEWNLFVNDTKTEYASVHLADKGELNDKGKEIRSGKLEEWRSEKLLGSLLGSAEDIRRRCHLGNVAFANYDKCWLKGPKIPLQTKLRLYDSLVVSIMLYNCNSWAAPKSVLEKLDTTHRRHLRRILNLYWPRGKIRNDELYKRCFNTVKLSDRVIKMRWTMLGHILRSDEMTPALVSLRFALSNDLRGRRGRHQCNLLELIKADLSDRDFRLKTLSDLETLRVIAFDRTQWRSWFNGDLLITSA